MPQFDSIIIGAGHNGLVCAAYLAKAGQRVAVLEAGDAPGGLAAAREFHPGFKAPIAHAHSHFAREITDELSLATHGFTAPDPRTHTVALDADAGPIAIGDTALSGADDRDAAAYTRYAALLRRFADALRPFWLKTMPRPGTGSFKDMATFAHLGLNLRRLGRSDMAEFLRVASLPARDLMDEYFESDSLKAALCWDGLVGSKMAPRSPNGAVLAMLYRLSERRAQPAGNVGALVSALVAAAKAAGAELRCETRVAKVLIEGSSDGLCATGVELDGGEQLSARRVVSSADPRRTFFDLAGIEHLDIGFTNRIRRLRCEGYVGKLHLALDGLPAFSGVDTPDGRLLAAGTMDTLEYAYDDAKYGNLPEVPVVEVRVPSLDDQTLAPAGQHVLSANVMYVPYALEGGWTDEARDRCRNSAIEVIARHAPALREQILFAEFLSPADIEREYRVTGGHWHHTEFAMDQMLMMRPTYEAAQYRTPIPGLYLCGAGTHPAGDLTGAAGRNAARELLA
ncbi:MAG: NAD(P)/FAD-dependent oxidoreductase [Pseudomonadota bacterium]